MNDLAAIREKLELTNEAMGRLNQMMRDAPDSAGLIANMNTLRMNHFRLEREFEETAKRVGVEVCSYRLFPEGTERQSIVGVGKAWINFQSLFSLVYGAVKREYSPYGKASPDETSLDFAYTYPGSIGVALTIPSQANIFGNYYHDAISTLFNMAKAQSANELKTFSGRVGISAMRAMYKWADDLVSAGFGIDIQWKSNNVSDLRIYLQKSELTSLKAIMQATSEDHREEFTKSGVLQGIDAPKHSFHFEYKDESGKSINIYGKFTDAIGPVKIPSRCKASIQKTTRVFYSTDVEVSEYLLLLIKTVKSRGKKQSK